MDEVMQGPTREEMIGIVINSRYTINDQIALLRQKDEKPEEWAEFNAYAERIKKEITAEYENKGE